MSKEVIDERKRKRMLSNRESARRSRMRKQQHLDDLVNQVARMKEENSQILVQVNLVTGRYSKLDAENTVMRTRVMELTERLQSMNSMLRLVATVSGMAMDIPEITDPLLKPLQLPSPVQTIMMPAYMFHC